MDRVIMPAHILLLFWPNISPGPCPCEFVPYSAGPCVGPVVINSYDIFNDLFLLIKWKERNKKIKES